MLIEFVGLPGSGKTEICNCLNKHAEQNGVDVIFSSNMYLRSWKAVMGRKLAGLTRIMQCAIIRPKESLMLFKYGFACRPLSISRVIRIMSAMAFIRRLEIERNIANHKQKATVFEQGLVQMLGSLAVPGNINSMPDSSRLAESVVSHRINGLILVDCSEETALSRVRNRSHGRSRFDIWSDEKAMYSMQVMKNVLNMIVEIAEKAGVRVLRLNGLSPAEINSIKVASWLQVFEGVK